MGCGASNNNSSGNNNNRRVRSSNTTTVPVQSHNLASRNSLVPRPLTLVKNYRYGSSIQQSDLDRLRSEFWGTRTEGNSIMWQNIRTAAEAVISNDLELATAILEASNIITTTGTLEVCYDELGTQYKVPLYCIANPIELGSDGNNSNNNQSTLPTANAVSNTVIEAVPLKLKVRINPGDINMSVNVDTGNSILELKKSIAEQSVQAAIPVSVDKMQETRQRIIFMGRELKNNQLIRDIGIDDQKVIQVFLRPPVET